MPNYALAFNHCNDYTLLEIKSDRDEFFEPSAIKIGSVIKSPAACEKNPVFFFIIDIYIM